MIKHTVHEAVTLHDELLQIARGLQPTKWYHVCKEQNYKAIEMESNQICPVCFVDEYGAVRKRKDKG